MQERGAFIVFESGSKGGKTTLLANLAERLRGAFSDRRIVPGRSALTHSAFATKVKEREIGDPGYSTAFYWADLVFHTLDVIRPIVDAGGVAVYDRYDISIIAHREVHGLRDDDLLLEEYLDRGMLLHPDLTVFLDPPVEAMLSRIASTADSSPIDLAFLEAPELLAMFQERIRHHIRELGRNSITLNTAELSTEECLDALVERIAPML